MITTNISMPNEVIRRFATKKSLCYTDSCSIFKSLEEFLDEAAFRDKVPSPLVDEAWHEFILHTRLYADYCRSRYNRFVHHVPALQTKCNLPAEEENEDEETDREPTKCSSALMNSPFTAVGDGDRCSSDCSSGNDN